MDPAELRSKEQLVAELAELREREQCYRTYVEKGPHAIYVVNAEGRYIDVNPAACRQSGYSKAELLRLSFLDLAASPDATLDAFAKIQRHGSLDIKLDVRRKDGSVFTASVNAVQITPDSYMAFVTDITKLEAQEAELRKERDLAQSYLDTVEAVIVALDVEGRITLINRKGCRLLGYREDELLGRSWFATCLPQPEGLTDVYPYFRRLFAGEVEAVEYFENPVVTRTGEVREIAWHNTLLRNAQGEITGTLSAGEDITERKRLEQQLLEGQKLEAIGTLAGGVAHDMNNVLAVVLGFAELSVDELADDHLVQPYLRDIIDAARRGKSLVENLLGFARKARHEKRPLALNEIITKLASVLRQSLRKEIHVRTDLAPSLGAIRGDRAQITQTLMNLCINAADALEGAGTITVTTREQELASGEITQLVGGRYIRIEIRDDGVGMSEAVRAKVFEPFFTTKPVGKGTGLGLAMAHGVVTHHHGAIDIASTLGQGTTVTLWFPLADALAETEPAPASAPCSHSSGASSQATTVLVVDDEALVRKVVCRLLDALGYDPISAENARAAIELYRERGAEIDLVLLDLSMPDMSGAECFSALQALDPEVKVVLCTGHGERAVTDELRRRGAAGIARKPFMSDMLAWSIQEALGEATACPR